MAGGVLCSNSPARAYVTVSKPRCGWSGAPTASPARIRPGHLIDEQEGIDHFQLLAGQRARTRSQLPRAGDGSDDSARLADRHGRVDVEGLLDSRR